MAELAGALRVAFRHLPVRLFFAWEEYSDALLREYVLMAESAGRPFGLNDVARARTARLTVSEQLRAAIGEDAGSVDFAATLEGDVSESDFAVLQAVLDDATHLAACGELLTLPLLPELVALRNWVCEEVVAQAAGQPPTPWRDPGPTAAPDAPLAEWAGADALPVGQSWLVGDDHNRIIGASASALELLGWERDALIGQRILVVIPPELREGHIAGFTRAAALGEYRLLGQPLAVSAWTRDGRPVPVTLTLERHSARRGRTVFVAHLEPSGTP